MYCTPNLDWKCFSLFKTNNIIQLCNPNLGKIYSSPTPPPPPRPATTIHLSSKDGQAPKGDPPRQFTLHQETFQPLPQPKWPWKHFLNMFWGLESFFSIFNVQRLKGSSHFFLNFFLLNGWIWPVKSGIQQPKLSVIYSTDPGIVFWYSIFQGLLELLSHGYVK